MAERCLLLTGATGKVGQQFLKLLFDSPEHRDIRVRALCHNRLLEPNDRLEVVKGSISCEKTVAEAFEGVTHVLHLATCKETPADIMDVTVKGLFWMLETARQSPLFEQFILVGGDACMGHFFYPHPLPVTESQPHSAYPGCYALSKVLEETMLEQYYHQYDLNGCCLRAPWIMEKDDFKFQLSFGPDVFGGPRWMDLVGEEKARSLEEKGAVPVMLDPDGVPVKRNFVHVSDLVRALLAVIDHPSARQQLFNICMNEPVDYGELAAYLNSTRGLPSVEIQTPYRSTWLDNSKARFLLGWAPDFDLEKMTDEAFDFKRSPDDPRIVHYPG